MKGELRLTFFTYVEGSDRLLLHPHPKYPVEVADEVLVSTYGEVFGADVGVGFEDVDAEVLEGAFHGVYGVAHAVGVASADAE